MGASELDPIKRFDIKLISFLNRVSLPALRISLGVIFIWFGLLKVFGESPANDLITKTVYWFNPDVFIPILGIWEAAIGLCLLFPFFNRLGLFLLALVVGSAKLPYLRSSPCRKSLSCTCGIWGWALDTGRQMLQHRKSCYIGAVAR